MFLPVHLKLGHSGWPCWKLPSPWWEDIWEESEIQFSVFHCWAQTQDMPSKSRAVRLCPAHRSFRWTAEHLSPWKQCSHTQPLYPSPPPASQQVWDNDTVASWCHTQTTVQFVVLSCPVPATVQRLPCSWFSPVCRRLYSSDICKWLCYSWCNCSLEDPSCWGVLQSSEATAVFPQCARASLQVFFQMIMVSPWL